MKAVLFKDGDILGGIVQNSDVAIVCRYVGSSKWEPTNAIVDRVITELPSCFELNSESIAALEAARKEGQC